MAVSNRNYMSGQLLGYGEKTRNLVEFLPRDMEVTFYAISTNGSIEKMTYEEKRELRLQISQLLADAGLNQKTIKDIVEKEISNKVDRAVEQVFKSLDAQSSSGHYVNERISQYLSNHYMIDSRFDRAVKEELGKRVIQVVLKDVTNE